MRESLADDILLSVRENEETWRVSLRVPLAGETDFGGLEVATHETTMRVKTEFFAKEANAGLEIPEAIYTGASHLFHEAQGALLADLGRNFGMAFIIITPVMIICLRSIRLGLMAMVPNPDGRLILSCSMAPPAIDIG